jgi:DNA-binding CsgD family transcriptional regulator
MGREESPHQNKAVGLRKSHAAPKLRDSVTPDVTPDDKFVLLCDWHGRVVWGSRKFSQLCEGDLVWKYLAPDSEALVQEAVSRVVTLRENRVLEIANNCGQHCRVWLWPLNAPDVAVCVLGVVIPAELALLTERERECLQWLGGGHSTREIAEELDIGLTTLHTHLRRCREKLGLPSSDALISFAARYCGSAPQATLEPSQSPDTLRISPGAPAGRGN